ncbi:hypothetical protein DSM106972_050510 [Dulcicalothrix desertica PCC 7102]|uniref:Spore coat protein U domain-containing protein n=1 Tax=Dulcicalothrix desertica PCC 7102 TaxID=232991 RepID=A0A3S1CH59_9CYAN|nr:hypothetical protein [Dulcicalothrix desertica]RUT03412.1 hypothetical protein DSM106972_050510 [Dulcicalothrix desertica PCC 7102]TWH50663.1 hypothetical protein CAL7102_04994 [Dulcicalothrix desertica PCC 7102]
MLRQALLSSALLLSSTIVSMSSVKAAPLPSTQDVFFNGSIISGCKFNSKTDGTVTPNALFAANSLGSTVTYTGATSGEVKVVCNGTGGQVSASLPTAEIAPTGATFDATTSSLNGVIGSVAQPVLANIESTLKVDMTATSLAAPLPVGDYRFKVVVTAAPN